MSTYHAEVDALRELQRSLDSYIERTNAHAQTIALLQAQQNDAWQSARQAGYAFGVAEAGQDLALVKKVLTFAEEIYKELA